VAADGTGWREHRGAGVPDDIAHGNEDLMTGAEERGMQYVFKLRQTKGLIGLIEELTADFRA
jgi:hypothetical protein